MSHAAFRLVILVLLAGACSAPRPARKRQPPPRDAAVAALVDAAAVKPARVEIPLPPPRLDVRLDPATAARLPGPGGGDP